MEWFHCIYELRGEQLFCTAILYDCEFVLSRRLSFSLKSHRANRSQRLTMHSKFRRFIQMRLAPNTFKYLRYDVVLCTLSNKTNRMSSRSLNCMSESLQGVHAKMSRLSPFVLSNIQFYFIQRQTPGGVKGCYTNIPPSKAWRKALKYDQIGLVPTLHKVSVVRALCRSES